MLQQYFVQIKYMLHGGNIFREWLFFDKAVTDVSHSLDINVRWVFYFAPESADVDIYRSISAKIIFAPDLVEQSITGKDSSGMTGEKF